MLGINCQRYRLQLVSQPHLPGGWALVESTHYITIVLVDVDIELFESGQVVKLRCMTARKLLQVKVQLLV